MYTDTPLYPQNPDIPHTSYRVRPVPIRKTDYPGLASIYTEASRARQVTRSLEAVEGTPRSHKIRMTDDRLM